MAERFNSYLENLDEGSWRELCVGRGELRRYNHLISTHPDLFNLFSLKDIASFLNITPTHLSRLRRKI